MQQVVARVGLLLCLAAVTFPQASVLASLGEAAVASPIIPMDLRSRALGEAGVALPDASFGIDINPALLLQTRTWNAGYNYGEWLPMSLYDNTITAFYGSIGSRALGRDGGPRMAFGFGYKRLTIKDQTRVDEFGNILGRLEMVEWVASASGALALRENVGVGASLKLIHSTVGDYYGPDLEASSWALDLGFYASGLWPQASIVDHSSWYPESSLWNRMQIPRQPGFGIGVSVQNLGPGIDYIGNGNSDPLPRVANVGISYRPYDTETLGILLVSQMQQSLVASEDLLKDGEFAVSWGIELGIMRLVDLRTGRIHPAGGPSVTQTFGLGVGFERIRIDYYRVESEQSYMDKTDMVSLTIRW